MDKLKFINKLIEDRTDSKERFESYSKKYPNDEVFIKCKKACEEALEILKQIKTDLETIESTKQLGINLEDLFKEFIDIKNNLGEVDSDITPDYLAYVVSNGITYGKLSKELGCDLDVVFNALKQGYIYVYDNHYNYDDYTTTRAKITFNNDKFYIGFARNTRRLEDYQKTWWLNSDKKEISNDN